VHIDAMDVAVATVALQEAEERRELGRSFVFA